MRKLLEASNIVKSFGGVQALKGVDFDLLPGEVHALIGENGAGKSTLINILTGNLFPDSGEYSVTGEKRFFASPHEAQIAGIHVIHQELSVVPYLDVATNLALGALPTRKGFVSRMLGLIDRTEIHRRALHSLERVGNPVVPSMLASHLSVAQLQLIEIARALDGDFRIIFFDEPTSSLGVAERDELFRQIREMLKRGIGVVYTSHRLDEVLELADRVTVLKDGSVVDSGSASGFDLNRIVRGIIGGDSPTLERARRSIGDVVLEVRHLTSPPVVEDVSITLRAGEVVALAGLIGAGRTEFAECIFGARTYTGEIRISGQVVNPQSPAEAIELGLAYSTEDRKGAGLFHHLSTLKNISVGALSGANRDHHYARGGQILRQSQLRLLADQLIERLSIRPSSLLSRVGAMSGGNQQKVVFARLIAGKPRILILDEPTRGVDIAAKAQIWNVIHHLASEGVPVLVISSDIRELIGNVDRAVVMRRGRFVAEIGGSEISEEGITRYAI